jgi:hypothetical protein
MPAPHRRPSPSLPCDPAQDACLGRCGSKWVPLFNGKDLSGWTIKIAKRPLGENFANTFRVEDGILKVSYDGYEKFDEQFGHLFTNLAYSHYILRLEYRFTGTMMADAPKYVNLNSGVMLHAQPPQSMRFDQGFPASLEMQFLADEGKGERSTGNLCTPGTHVEMGGSLSPSTSSNPAPRPSRRRNGCAPKSRCVAMTKSFPDLILCGGVEVNGIADVGLQIAGIDAGRVRHDFGKASWISFIALRFVSSGSGFISPMVQAMKGRSGSARSVRRASIIARRRSGC